MSDPIKILVIVALFALLGIAIACDPAGEYKPVFNGHGYVAVTDTVAGHQYVVFMTNRGYISAEHAPSCPCMQDPCDYDYDDLFVGDTNNGV